MDCTSTGSVVAKSGILACKRNAGNHKPFLFFSVSVLELSSFSYVFFWKALSSLKLGL